jgi:alkyl sulfatase BDS1-like metallo-beta-lactamase superfamily hydrolase
MNRKIFVSLSIFVALSFLVMAIAGCSGRQEQKQSQLPGKTSDALATLSGHFKSDVGEPRVEKVSEHVWAAIGYDLASVALIHTDAGNIIVDTGQRPAAARVIKKALMANAPPGPLKAIIYTHSHLDHTGGASEWVETGTQIWAADNFVANFMKQYGAFKQAEKDRGYRQFGYSLSAADLPFSSIGPVNRSYTEEELAQVGALMPTNTFSGRKALEIGGLTIELIAAPGETDDTIYAWVPADKTLLCADNYYSVFPNLYTIRGTSPRPVDSWINSLDEIRRIQPEHLVPGHTALINGSGKISEIITNYRDAIQWVRDDVIRRANEGQDIDTIAENVKLPDRLAKLPYLWEGYGQVAWSARAIYFNNLGWFDGRADKLYPLPHKEIAKREVALMGGAEALLGIAAKELEGGDPAWAVYLLSKLKDSGLADDGKVNGMLAQGYRKIGDGIANTNGRAYLLVSAQELEVKKAQDSTNVLNPGLVASLPIDVIFAGMQQRLDPDKASGIVESAAFIFPDIEGRITVTVRNGIAEIIKGDPLPGTPPPVVTVTVDSVTYKMLAMKVVTAQSVIQQGKMKVEGSLPAFAAFMGRFQGSTK